MATDSILDIEYVDDVPELDIKTIYTSEKVMSAFMGVWFLLGIAAFIYSYFYCDKKLEIKLRLLQFLLALLLGPFYFIYLIAKNKCK